jgi:hypothetical protein
VRWKNWASRNKNPVIRHFSGLATLACLCRNVPLVITRFNPIIHAGGAIRMTTLLIDKIDSEIGEILVVSDGESLSSLDFSDYEPRMMRLLEKRYGSVNLIEKENPQGFSDRIRAYLSGDYNSLDDIPVKTGGTPFQQQVWLALRTIPLGTVISYGNWRQNWVSQPLIGQWDDKLT